VLRVKRFRKVPRESVSDETVKLLRAEVAQLERDCADLVRALELERKRTVDLELALGEARFQIRHFNELAKFAAHLESENARLRARS
jgi:uncharacterized protein involved in exopolysaccharide biosynthesis